MNNKTESKHGASISVLLVEDQQLMRDGIKMLLELEEGINLVGEATNGEEAVSLYKQKQPDVVLMDIEMPVMSGIEATKKIKILNPQARVIILTTFGQEEYLHNGLLAGAQGFLLKAVSGEELADSIRKMKRGQSVIDSRSTEILLNRYRSLVETNTNTKKPLLGAREIQILNFVAKQCNNREIACKLQLAEGTVKNYISQILEKLQARDRNEAVVIAKNQGLIE